MSGVHVQVRVGAELYALQVASILEIGEVGVLTATPGASSATLGVRNLRGDLLPVFDLAAALGVPRGQSPRCMLGAECGGTRAGLAVDEVVDVGELPEADQEVESDLLTSAALVSGSLVGVIDVDRLFDTLASAA